MDHHYYAGNLYCWHKAATRSQALWLAKRQIAHAANQRSLAHGNVNAVIFTCRVLAPINHHYSIRGAVPETDYESPCLYTVKALGHKRETTTEDRSYR